MTSRNVNNNSSPGFTDNLPTPRSGRPCSRLVTGLLVAGVVVFSTVAGAQNNSTKPPADQASLEKHLAEILSFAKDDGFVYRREGRADPFVPFITEKMLQAEASKSKKKLSGLQRLEPGQLSLVAVVFAGDTGIAMAQDSVGMGYVIRKGMRIGLSGVVDAIVPNAVIIKQKYKTISGRSRYRTVEMVLKKEGEK